MLQINARSVQHPMVDLEQQGMDGSVQALHLIDMTQSLHMES